MKPSQIFDILDLTRRARQNGDTFNPCFVGAPGLGKTEIVQQWAKERGLQTVTITSALYEAPDVKGFPVITTVTDVNGNTRQRQSYATPDYWPDGGEGVVILEEINRGSSSIMNCWMGLTDARRGFDGYKLPPGWIVVGCINPDVDGYDVNAMDPALKDRLEFVPVTYDKKSFVDYMKKSEWHQSIITFVEANIFNYKLPEEINAPGAKYIAPRTLSKLNTLLRAGFNADDELELYTLVLGQLVAKDFFSHRHNEAPVMMVDLNNNLKASLKKLEKFSDPDNYKSGMISLTCGDIVLENTITDEVLVKVALTIPVEMSTVLIRDLEIKRKDDDLLPRLCKQYPDLKKLYKDVINHGRKTK